MNRAKLLVLPATAGLIVPLLAGCAGGFGSEDVGGSSPIVMGSTDERITSLDPAGAYDIGTWTLFTNAFQTLLRYPQDGSEPQPEAAEKCAFTDRDSTAYRCKLRSGMRFSNGHELTAEDVAYSIRRSMQIRDGNGPSVLFSNIERVEDADDTTVVFHLKKPDATLPFVLATPAAAIVDSEVYPRDRLLAEDRIAGSGVYSLDDLERPKGDRERVLKAEFSANPRYKGTVRSKNTKFTVRYFQNSETMQAALEKGEIDLIHRALTPQQVREVENSTGKGVKLVQASGSEIRYLVFNPDKNPVRNVAVRRAIAQLIDRQKLIHAVYLRTVEPLNSVIPKGITGHNNAFYNLYGDPSESKARAILQKANIATPIPLTLWYTSDHYGSVTRLEFEEIKRQLEGSGLFRVSLKSRKWPQYQKGYQHGEYAVFGMGWFPDFPDPDNYISPFMSKGNYFKSPYFNGTIVNQILPRSRRQSNRSAVIDEFGRAQKIIAEDVPMLPLWQTKQYVATRDDVSGVEWTLDVSTTFRFWELSKSPNS